MTANAVGIGNPHTRAKNTREVEGTKAEAKETREEQVNTKHLGQIESRLARARVAEKLEIPIYPVPASSQEQ